MDFLRNKKHATNKNWHWALDQYVSPKNHIKCCQKYVEIVEYWHETIKSYRYDRDISNSITMVSPAAFRRHRERGGESPPPSSSLASPLEGRRVPPLVHGRHGSRRGGAPPRLDLSLSLFSSVSRYCFLAENRFLNSWRSVTPIGLNF